MTLPSIASKLPAWAILSLPRAVSAEELCAAAREVGVGASVASDGSIQFPSGFLGWIDPAPLAPQLLDRSVSATPPRPTVACLHVSGGTLELERQSHAAPAAIRAMTTEMRQRLDAVTAPPGQTPRIISGAAAKVERLTSLLRGLAPLVEEVTLPMANDMTFAIEAFVERSASFAEGHYHYPLYTYLKVRNDDDGPYVCTTGMELFALPEIASPIGEGLAPADAARVIGELQREMVAEGWWPEDGARFDGSRGPVRLASLGGVVFATLADAPLDPDAIARARYRFARERVFAAGGPEIMHRVRRPSLIVDHHLRRRGSHAITNGLAFHAQPGGRAADANARVELILRSDALGPWATGWLAWIADALVGHDGTHPFRPFDRVVLDEPMAEIAGCVLWPWGEPTPGLGAEPVVTWALVPILVEELQRFRAQPGAQAAWIDERVARRDLAEIEHRWERAASAS
jgi:hypothetical protein